MCVAVPLVPSEHRQSRGEGPFAAIALVMNTHHPTDLLHVAAVLVLAAWCIPEARGGLSLTNIPPVPGDTSNEGRAITPDGKYVGGLSGNSNGFFYDVMNDFVTVPLAGGYAGIVTGIGYRTDSSQAPSVVQVVLDGSNSGWHGQFMTSDGGLTWGFKRRDNASPAYAWADYPPPVANSLAATTESDVYFTIFPALTATSSSVSRPLRLAVPICMGIKPW